MNNTQIITTEELARYERAMMRNGYTPDTNMLAMIALKLVSKKPTLHAFEVRQCLAEFIPGFLPMLAAERGENPMQILKALHNNPGGIETRAALLDVLKQLEKEANQ